MHDEVKLLLLLLFYLSKYEINPLKTDAVYMFPMFLGNFCVGAVCFSNNCAVCFKISELDNKSTVKSVCLIKVFFF